MQPKEKSLTTFVGLKIKEYRKNKKLTQKQLGVLIGKSDNTISNYETGLIAPSLEALHAIAIALDIRIDDLFPERDKIHSSS